ncbi:MAG: hypothetical protein KKD44_03175 [Proteobacteria bacterium]|nr:hypothetical protein [Pseudomonadota bacterium]
MKQSNPKNKTQSPLKDRPLDEKQLKTRIEQLEKVNEQFRQDRDLLDKMLQQRAILQRGDYISTKLESASSDDSESTPCSDYKLVIAEVVARESEFDFEENEAANTDKPLFVEDFDSVLLDAGSTIERIAQQLFEHRKYLTILTNNMGVWANFCGTTAKSLKELLEELKKTTGKASRAQKYSTSQKISEIQAKNELVLTGGRYAQMYDSLLGDQTIKAFETFSPSIVIIGTSGIIADEGLFCHGGEESNVKKHLWNTKTSKRIIATSSEKIGKRDSHRFGDIQKSKSYLDGEGTETILITDRNRRLNNDNDYIREYEKLKKYLYIIEVECHREEGGDYFAYLYSSKLKDDKLLKKIKLKQSKPELLMGDD